MEDTEEYARPKHPLLRIITLGEFAIERGAQRVGQPRAGYDPVEGARVPPQPPGNA